MKSGSLYFPFTEDIQKGGLKRASTINDVIKSAIKCYILTKPGQRRGNPIGCFLSDMKHQLIRENELAGISDELKKDLTAQFPGVNFTNVEIIKSLEDNVSNLEVTIQFGTALSDLDELAVIVQI